MAVEVNAPSAHNIPIDLRRHSRNICRMLMIGLSQACPDLNLTKAP